MCEVSGVCVCVCVCEVRSLMMGDVFCLPQTDDGFIGHHSNSDSLMRKAETHRTTEYTPTFSLSPSYTQMPTETHTHTHTHTNTPTHNLCNIKKQLNTHVTHSLLTHLERIKLYNYKVITNHCILLKHYGIRIQ